MLQLTFTIPLMILDDIPKPCKEPFKHLSVADSNSQTSASAGLTITNPTAMRSNIQHLHNFVELTLSVEAQF